MNAPTQRIEVEFWDHESKYRCRIIDVPVTWLMLLFDEATTSQFRTLVASRLHVENHNINRVRCFKLLNEKGATS